MKNPLITGLNELIDFKKINSEEVSEATALAISAAKDSLQKIYGIAVAERTFENTMRALDDIQNELVKVSEVISLLAYVHPNDDTRSKCLESISEFGKFFNEIGLSEELYHAVKEYSTKNEVQFLSESNKKYLKETVEEFERNGFALPKEKGAS